MISVTKCMKIAALALWAAARPALGADLCIAVGEAISEQSQLAVDQLEKCGTSVETVSSMSGGKKAPARITRMYYSSEARVFIELVTLNDTVEELMWQRYDPNSSSFAELDFAAASEVSITGKQFSATTTKLETKKQEAEQATPRQRKPNGQQDGTDQPATAPESQAEDSDKSQTEAEGRSR